MRFSGHETFSIREGWLYKGLNLLVNEPDKLHHRFVADYLGVGSNMAKSIRYWLQATKLAIQDPKKRGRLKQTNFGAVIFENDPYFIETDTWWLLHINLVSSVPFANTWYWFFNYFNLERFERTVVVENLRQYIQLHNRKIPSFKTLDRDVSCLLSSYSHHIPLEYVDPEEARDCPFRELGLMNFMRSSGYYRMQYRTKDIHPCIFGYCTSKAFGDIGHGDIHIQRLLREPGGPGRAFALTSESLHEAIVKIMGEYDEIRVHGHAGERAVFIPLRDPLDWVKEYYKSKKGGIL